MGDRFAAAGHFSNLGAVLKKIPDIIERALDFSPEDVPDRETIKQKFARALGAICLKFEAAYSTYALSTAIPALALATSPPNSFVNGGDKSMLMAVARNNAPDTLREIITRLIALLVALLEDAAQMHRLAASSGEKTRRGRPAKRSVTPGEKGAQHMLDLVRRIEQQVSCVGNANKFRDAMGGSQASARAAALTAAAENVAAVDCERCAECGVDLIIDPARSEARCPECSQVIEMHGVVYEDVYLRSQEGQRAKSGCFSPNAHGRQWLLRLQALEAESEIGTPGDPDNQCGEKLVAELKAIAQRQRKYLELLTLEDVRGLLRLAGKTKYNRNAALLLKKLSGKSPPILSENRRVRIETLFTRIIASRLRIAPLKPNRSYYPYYFYKIIDLEIPEDDSDRLLLCYIHLQGEATLKENDLEWREICEDLGLEWRPTDAAKTYQYHQRFD